MDSAAAMRETGRVVGAGATRDRLAGILRAAFAGGLLSEQTLSHRLNAVYGQRVVDPRGVVGDLTLRTRRGSWDRTPTTGRSLRRALALRELDPAPLILALDWGASGEQALLIGRSRECDVALEDGSVSGRHAKLLFRDGSWVVQDLGSTNGTSVNGEPVGRCELRPGDRLQLGELRLEVD